MTDPHLSPFAWPLLSFLNPSSHIPTLIDPCGFYDGRCAVPPGPAPQEVLRKAQRALKEETGCELSRPGELEYYLFQETCSPVEPQRGYHEWAPFGVERARKPCCTWCPWGCAVKWPPTRR